MPLMTRGLIAIIALTVALIVFIILRSSITAEKGGKIIAFVGFFILPIMAVAISGSVHLEKSKATDFCLKCHVMESYGQSLYIDDPNYIPANHFQNHLIPSDKACFTCHTSYTMFGGMKRKMQGLKHVYIYYLGKPIEKIELYDPYENRECLHCHEGARSFEENPIHESVVLEIMNNELSCLDCHDQIHNVTELAELPKWQKGEM
jgi:nitrate/TMAO reductase-like tetraheme cytochrome c subunit